MSESTTGPSGEFFDAAYRRKAPWDIGAAQPALLALFDEFPPASPALDVGCGTGALVFALAERGLSVVGVDRVPAAITQANDTAQRMAPELRERVQFVTGDALHPSQVAGAPFTTIVDCGFMHLFEPAEREQFARDLAAALSLGGRYYVLGFAFDSPVPNAPRRVSLDEISARFTIERGWRILTVRPATFTLNGPRPLVPATIACIERITHP